MLLFHRDSSMRLEQMVSTIKAHFLHELHDQGTRRIWCLLGKPIMCDQMLWSQRTKLEHYMLTTRKGVLLWTLTSWRKHWRNNWAAVAEWRPGRCGDIAIWSTTTLLKSWRSRLSDHPEALRPLYMYSSKFWLNSSPASQTSHSWQRDIFIIPVHKIFAGLTASESCLTGCDSVSVFRGHGLKLAFQILLEKSDKYQTGSRPQSQMSKKNCLYWDRYLWTLLPNLNKLRYESFKHKKGIAKKLPPSLHVIPSKIICVMSICWSENRSVFVSRTFQTSHSMWLFTERGKAVALSCDDFRGICCTWTLRQHCVTHCVRQWQRAVCWRMLSLCI